MPIIKSAKKKMRKDKKRTRINNHYLKKIKTLAKSIDKLKGKKQKESVLKKLFSIVDKAAKRHIVHKNKANRLKSRLSKKVSSK